MSKDSQKLFLASGNRHKIEELRQLLEPLGYKLTSTLDLADAPEVEEDQSTLEGNALKKARFWHSKTGLPAIADDTGLEVDALNGRPGVYSARYAGENATDSDNVDKLLKELSGESNRLARFRTVVAFVNGDEEHHFEGVCEGEIISERMGDKGFGYDPVFLPKGYGRTFAELASEEKNEISHRGRALQKFLKFIG